MNKVEFADVIKELEGTIEHGHYVSALCPFHSDSSPSMLVFKDGYFKCLACGAKGTLNKLHKQLSGWVAPSVTQPTRPTVHLLPSDLDELYYECIEAHKTLLNFDDPLGNYLRQRGIHGRILPQKLGYIKGWYTIPIFDRNTFVGAVARAGRQVQEETGARFSIPIGQPSMLYVPDYKLVEDNEYIVVVFGMIDALSLCELGIPVCTPTSGKDSIHPEHLDVYRKHVIILPDKGEEETGRRLRDKLGWRGTLKIIDYPENCKDPNDLLVCGHSEFMIQEILHT